MFKPIGLMKNVKNISRSISQGLVLSVSLLLLPYQTVLAQAYETRVIIVNNVFLSTSVDLATDISPGLELNTPVDIIVSQSAPYQARLSWSGSVGATSYKVETLEPFEIVWGQAYEVDQYYTSVDTSELSIGEHSFRVMACKLDVCSSPSTIVSIEILVDTDRDGVTDELDICKASAPGDIVTDSGCTATTQDSDSDGITDDLDYCPDTPVGASIENPGYAERGCSLAQRDSDKDGIFNDVDSYPYQSATQCTGD